MISSGGSSETRQGGFFFASGYGQWILRITVGTTATGAGTITISNNLVTLPDGRQIVPITTTTPILVGTGATAETVTPSAVSGNLITATFSNVHSAGEIISSGSFGLVEAVNDAHNSGGGVVCIDSAWVAMGGVAGTITGAKGFLNAPLLDCRGTASGAAFSFKPASDGAVYAATAISWY